VGAIAAYDHQCRTRHQLSEVSEILNTSQLTELDIFFGILPGRYENFKPKWAKVVSFEGVKQQVRVYALRTPMNEEAAS
jgi:hypothetical protein